MSDWDDLRYVLAAVRGGGLSGAARALGTSHATVSRRIAAAEARLGASLFERRPDGLRPTAAGRRAAEAAALMEAEALALERAAAGLDASLAGPLRITAPQLLIEPVLAEPLAAFAAAHPGVEMTVLASNALLNLHRREADVALRITAAPPGSLWGVRLAQLRRAVYAAPRWVQAAERGEVVDWIAFTHWEEEAGALPGPGGRVAWRFDDMAAALGAARKGLGALRMPCFLGEGDPALARMPGQGPGQGPEPYLDLWALAHPDLARVERVRRFVRAMRRAMRPLHGLFIGAPGAGAGRAPGDGG
ncbi:LysR family transcriptional regulator [Rhodovulum sp. DZ06]|uniref:LysR family transcriptional regulator n=1 Tax=Rhodovulum sp. DZ06 TaxID=3425126 RepID=UPI003D33E55C